MIEYYLNKLEISRGECMKVRSIRFSTVLLIIGGYFLNPAGWIEAKQMIG